MLVAAEVLSQESPEEEEEQNVFVSVLTFLATLCSEEKDESVLEEQFVLESWVELRFVARLVLMAAEFQKELAARMEKSLDSTNSGAAPTMGEDANTIPGAFQNDLGQGLDVVDSCEQWLFCVLLDSGKH